MKCFLCQSDSLKPIYQTRTKTVFYCPNDGLFLSQDNTELKKLYDKKYYSDSPYPKLVDPNTFYWQNKLKKIIFLTGENKPKILDIGCGWGNYVKILHESKIPYLGIDTSDEAIKICQSQRLNCLKTNIDQLLKTSQGKYTAITLFQVVEHLKNPLPFLKSIRKLLKKNGLILITTPNNDSPFRILAGSRWSVYNTESHYVFYNKKNLRYSLTQAGYKNPQVIVDQVRFLSLGYIFKRLLNNIPRVLQNLSLPIPTDPWGDLEAVAYNL